MFLFNLNKSRKLQTINIEFFSWFEKFRIDPQILRKNNLLDLNPCHERNSLISRTDDIRQENSISGIFPISLSRFLARDKEIRISKEN